MHRLQIGIFLLLLSLPSFGASRLDTIHMPTRSAQNDRPIVVYLPDGYQDSPISETELTVVDTTRYPVLFLLHGINGDEYSWIRNGNIQTIMDSLIEHHIIRPCVVVMPNTNSGKYIWGKRYKGEKRKDRDRKVKGTMLNLLGYFKNRRGNFISYFDEIEDAVYATYRLSESPQDRAIAGLSNGSMQAATIAKMHPGQYAWVGLFSPVIFDQQLPDNGEDWCSTDELPHGTRFFVSVGKADIFRSYGVTFCQKLQKEHIPYVLINGNGGHDWKVWRKDFTTFIPYVFPYSNP